MWRTNMESNPNTSHEAGRIEGMRTEKKKRAGFRLFTGEIRPSHLRPAM
jgi:hypothetical protein